MGSYKYPPTPKNLPKVRKLTTMSWKADVAEFGYSIDSAAHLYVTANPFAAPATLVRVEGSMVRVDV